MAAALNLPIVIICNNVITVYPGPHIAWFPTRVIGSGLHAEVCQVRSQKLDHINALVSKQKISKTIMNNKRRPPVRSRVIGTNNSTPPHLNFIHRHLSLPLPPPSGSHYQRNVMNHPLFPQTSRQPYQQRHKNGSSYSKPLPQQKSPSPQQRKSLPQPAAPPRYMSSDVPQRHRSPDAPQRYRSPEPPHTRKSPEPPHKSRTPSFDRASTSTPIQELKLSPNINKKCIENKLLSVEGEDSMFYDEVEDRVSEEVKNNLRDLIGDHPEGIWCCDLPKLYMSRYMTELDYVAYKFRTLNEMCLYLASIFHYVRPNKGDFKLYDKRAPIPEDLSVQMCLESEEDKRSTAPNVVDESDIFLEALRFTDEPVNVVQYLEDIPRQWLSQDQQQGSLLDVWIAEVYDPSKFWFIINKQKLDDMMNEMQVYYAANKQKYEVPKHKLKEGLYCVAILFAEYHRAIVVAKSVTPTEDKIKLYFIDYGTVAKVSISGICYLHRKYAVLPQQALRGRLAGIYPTEAQQQWSRETSARFFDLIAEKPLVARIEKINLQKQFVHITLIETSPKGSSQPPIFINEVLLKEGYAVASPEAQKEIETNKYALPIVRHLHFYPTYEELEQGLVPSAPEMINLLNNGCSLELIYPQYFRRTYYKHELQKLRTEVFHSQCVSSDESADAPSSCSSGTTEEMKSSGVDELVNFTEDLIPDKGGTNSSETDTNPKISHQEKVDLESSQPAKVKELQDHPPENIAEKVVSFEAQQSSQTDTKQEVVVESTPTALTLRPPPGFERIQPGRAVEQNIMVPPQNCNCGTPIVQQNYFLPPYGGAYQLPYGYPSNYSLQMPFNCHYLPMYAFQQMVPPVVPQPIPTQLEPVISEYLNSLKNDSTSIVETEKSDTSDSEVVACGSLANKDKDAEAKIEVIEIVDEAQKAEKDESETKVSQQEEIKKDNNQQMQSINESEENTKQKKPKQRKHKTSESEQCVTSTKLKQEDEKARGSPKKEIPTQNKTKYQELTANVSKQRTPEKNKIEKSESPRNKTEKIKESVNTTENKQRTPEKNKIEKNESPRNKTDKTKESINTTENRQRTPEKNESNKTDKTKESIITTENSQVERNPKTEKSKSPSNKINKRKENVEIAENAEHKQAKSKQSKVSPSAKTKGKTDKGKSKNDKAKENADLSENKLTQCKTGILQVVEANNKTEKTDGVSNKNDKIIDISEQSENTLQPETKVLQPVETVDNWEELIDEDVCLLDTNETELIEILSRPDSRNDREQQLDVLEKFFVDNTAPLLPQKLTESDAQDECIEEIHEETTQIEPQNCVEKKVIAGKTINIVTWEKKHYFVCNEALKTYTGLELPVLNTKSRLSRRMIFMTDIDVNTINTEMQEEFSRNNLVTASKFGKFVHLIQLEQLPSFVETFAPDVKLNFADIL